MAIQAREVARSMLHKLAAQGDTLRIAALEMKPWRVSSAVTLPLDVAGLTQATDAFPVSTAGGSDQGGSDIEAGLQSLAGSAGGNPVLVVISRDASQLPADGKGRLMTEGAPSFKGSLNKDGLSASNGTGTLSTTGANCC